MTCSDGSLVGSVAASGGAGGARRTRNAPACSWVAVPWGADGLEVAFPEDSFVCFFLKLSVAFVGRIWLYCLKITKKIYFLQAIKGSWPLSQARPPGRAFGVSHQRLTARRGMCLVRSLDLWDLVERHFELLVTLLGTDLSSPGWFKVCVGCEGVRSLCV